MSSSIIWVSQGASLPNGIPKLTVSPTKTGDPDFFGSLSLSPKGVWSFQPFWQKLSSWDSIISYPILRIQTQKLNARIPMNDTSSSQFLLGPAVYYDHFCHDSVWRNPAHIYTYIFEKPWHFKRRTVETLHINSCRISPSWPTHGAWNAPRFKLQSKNP